MRNNKKNSKLTSIRRINILKRKGRIKVIIT